MFLKEFVSDVITPEHGSLLDLGVNARKFEDMAAWHLRVYNRLSFYDEKLGEFPDPYPPKSVDDDFEINFNK
jgi:hypothetical protein